MLVVILYLAPRGFYFSDFYFHPAGNISPDRGGVFPRRFNAIFPRRHTMNKRRTTSESTAAILATRDNPLARQEIAAALAVLRHHGIHKATLNAFAADDQEDAGWWVVPATGSIRPNPNPAFYVRAEEVAAQAGTPALEVGHVARDANYVRLQAAVIHQQLAGGNIERSVIGEGWDGQPGFGFEVRMPSGRLKTAWVVSAPEGKTPGFLEIPEQA
jgi:hypothetical protein